MSERIAVWFSCGAVSAVAAKLTLDKYGATHDVRVVNTPIAEEDEDNQRFAADVGAWLRVPIERASNPAWPDSSADSVWRARRYMSGVAGAPCTGELKKRARILWENKYTPTYHVLGFTSDEVKRHERFILTERDNVLPVLIDAGMTKADCAKYLQREGLRLPRVYELGYPNANCVGCVKATSPEYWNHVRKVHPQVFAQRAELSDELGVKLARYKGERIALSELPENARGRTMKSMNLDCGIFCEEKA